MTLPGERQNAIQRGTLRYRLYTNVETGLFNVDLAAAGSKVGNTICIEGYRHFQIWVSTTTPPTPLSVYILGVHPDPSIAQTTESMLVGAVTITGAATPASVYFGESRFPTAGAQGSFFIIGRFIRIALVNTGGALEQGIQGYLEATG